jgi:hypothetical protein
MMVVQDKAKPVTSWTGCKREEGRKEGRKKRRKEVRGHDKERKRERERTGIPQSPSRACSHNLKTSH